MGWDWQTIKHLLMIRKEDYLNSSLLFLYLFLVITSLMIGKSVSTALFISTFGAMQLPYAIIGQTILITILIAGYLRLWRVYQPPVLISSSLLLLGASGVLLWWLLRHHVTGVIPLLYVWGGIFGVVAPVQVWTLGNFIFTTRDARRYFGFIGSGGILGFICGGYFIKKLAPLFGAETLLPSVAVFCCFSALLVQWIWRRNQDRITELQTDSGRDFSLKQSALCIWNSKYLLLITLLVTIASLATKIVDVQFSAITAQFIQDKNEMTAFFGSVITYMGWGAFLLQLLLGGKMLDKLGIGITILVLPLSLLTSTLAALLVTALWTAVLLRLSDQVFKHSIDKSTTELLYLPIPTDVKIQVKSFIDTVILRAGDGLAALLLLLFTNVIPLINRAHPGSISLLNLPIIGLLLYIAFQIRKEYLNALRSGFRNRGLDPHDISHYIAEPATLEELNKYLASPETEEVLYALDILTQGEHREELLLPHLRHLLQHPTAAIRLKALQMLSTFSRDYVVPEAEALLNDSDFAIRAEAARYVYTYSQTDILTRIQSLPDYPDYVIQGGILLNLLQQNRPDNWGVARLILDGMVRNKDEDGKAARIEAARVLGLISLPVKWHCHLVDLMQDDAPDVVRQALDSAGRTQHHDFIPFLLEALADRHTQVAAREALVHFGHRILGTLKDHLSDTSVPAELRNHIPRVLSRIGGQEAVEILLDCLDQKDVALRYKILKALNRLRSSDATLKFDEHKILNPLFAELKQYYRYTQLLVAFNPTAPPMLETGPRRLDLLTTSVLERQDRAMERVFRFLGLLYSHNDIHQAFYGLRSPRPQNRANTVEFLDNLLNPALRKFILPLIDSKVTLGQRARKGRAFWKWKLLTREESLAELLSASNRWLCACAMSAASELEVNGLTALIQQLALSPDSLLSETATWVLHQKTLRPMKEDDFSPVALAGVE
ncbi:MAG: HEAT repeat domain-containing protein [Blastocatellia bacterium]|nr:HEAT repeat domain-containing protein [Blastocatellia bacterium]